MCEVRMNELKIYPRFYTIFDGSSPAHFTDQPHKENIMTDKV